MIVTDSRIGREALFKQLGFVPRNVKQARQSWGEYIGEDLLLQLHLVDVLEHDNCYIVRILGWPDSNGECRNKARLQHVEDIRQGIAAYAVFDERAGTQAYADYCYELGSELFELPSGTYVEVKKRLTVEEFTKR